MGAIFQAVLDMQYIPVNCGKIPTPTIVYYGIKREIPSIMVTGSHIPDDRNGIKFNKSNGEITLSSLQGGQNPYSIQWSNGISNNPEIDDLANGQYSVTVTDATVCELSDTVELFVDTLFVDYEKTFAIIELFGEWNDCVENDVMYLKRNIVDKMLKKGIHKYILICDNLLVYHAGDEDYYEEWIEDINEERGWICLLNTNDPVYSELKTYRRSNYLSFGGELKEVNWRLYKPGPLFKLIDGMLNANAQIPARF